MILSLQTDEQTPTQTRGKIGIEEHFFADRPHKLIQA